MSPKSKQITYLISTGLLTALMLMSAGMYFFNYEMITATFTKLNYPAYLVYPLAVAKILGLIAIWTKKSDTLKEWAYAGFFFDVVLALLAHLYANDGEYAPALVGVVLVLVSYLFEKKVKGE
ncbi:MAG: DoxX family protein [Aureispira sp.]